MNPVFDPWSFGRSSSLVESRLPLARMVRLAASLIDPSGEAQVRCTGMLDDHGRPAMRLEVRARLPVRCDRCSGALEQVVESDRVFHFVRSEEELNAIPVDPLEPSEPLVGGDRFELAPVVEDELILSLPISPRHESCTAPSELPAGEDREERQHPFAALGRLRRPS